MVEACCKVCCKPFLDPGARVLALVQEARVCSLAIVEAERGVTHLMLNLHVNCGGEAHARDAQELEIQQLRLRVHQLEQELASARADKMHSTILAAHAETKVAALRRQVQNILEVITGGPVDALLLHEASLADQDMPFGGMLDQSCDHGGLLGQTLRTAQLAHLPSPAPWAAERGKTGRKHECVINMQLVQGFAHEFEQAGGAGTPLALCDASGAILWANTLFTHASGHSSDELLGCRWHSVLLGPLSDASDLSRVDTMMQLRLPLSS